MSVSGAWTTTLCFTVLLDDTLAKVLVTVPLPIVQLGEHCTSCRVPCGPCGSVLVTTILVTFLGPLFFTLTV